MGRSPSRTGQKLSKVCSFCSEWVVVYDALNQRLTSSRPSSSWNVRDKNKQLNLSSFLVKRMKSFPIRMEPLKKTRMFMYLKKKKKYQDKCSLLVCEKSVIILTTLIRFHTGQCEWTLGIVCLICRIGWHALLRLFKTFPLSSLCRVWDVVMWKCMHFMVWMVQFSLLYSLGSIPVPSSRKHSINPPLRSGLFSDWP